MQTQQLTKPRAKSKSSQKFFCPIESKSKLKIWFKDGNVRTFYSNLKKDKISMQHGVAALEKFVNSKDIAFSYKTAVIYVNRYNGGFISKFVNGVKKEN